MKSARRRARELTLQALYQWQLSGQNVAFIEQQFVDGKDYATAFWVSALCPVLGYALWFALSHGTGFDEEPVPTVRT